uniref:Uncharacterized protein n=1 Tax=Ananas comosus var. bracteatus TaxID=296719 RepID=A0A6V7Q543_ANACO|nr:unnamed protein product [Ananas comosus var. bracteatus]
MTWREGRDRRGGSETLGSRAPTAEDASFCGGALARRAEVRISTREEQLLREYDFLLQGTDKPLPSATRCEVSTYRNMRQSPSWSFRWDNRTHIEDIMDNTAQFSQHSSNSSNAASEIKNEAVVENEGLLVGGSSLDAISAEKQEKSHIETGTTGKSKAVLTDQTMESNFSPEEKDPVKPSGKASVDSSKPSTSLPQTPSSSTFKSDPSSSTSHSQLSGPASSKKPRQSDCRSSSDGWSMHLFSELISSSQRERLSFDSENLNSINTSKASRSNTQQSSPHCPQKTKNAKYA